MTLVFQYGSNCSITRLNSYDRLRGEARPLGWAETLDNFELQFDVWSFKNNCAASNIVRGGDHSVQGVLYDIPDHLMAKATASLLERRSFDEIEGGAYKRIRITVRDREGNELDAQTYVVRNPKSGLLTSSEYVAHIIRGLREHHASEEYIAKVKRSATTNNPRIAATIADL